jgi:aspartate-semialdehyde dehydrogenase
MAGHPIELAILGATGAVGRAVLEELEESEVALGRVRLFASERSRDQVLELRGEELEVEVAGERSFRGCDVAILAVPAPVAREWAPRARADGCPVVDASAAFREDPAVPLVVAGVNEGDLAGARARGMVAGPSGPALALARALAPIHRAAGLERLAVTVFHAASGSGAAGVRQLEAESVALLNGEEPGSSGVSHRLAFNLVPQVGEVLAGGRTAEERAVEVELRRILAAGELRATATAVRVPVFYAHGLAVNLRTARPMGAEEARAALRGGPGVKVVDAPVERVYPMPMLAVSDDAVLVGRVREDPSQENGLDLFVCADNLRHGAAANAVRLALSLAGRSVANLAGPPPEGASG